MRRAGKLAAIVAVAAICAGALAWSRRDATAAAPGADREIDAVVLAQLRAFRAEDFAGAYRQASSGFQGKWKVQDFATMVRMQYATMLQPARIEFGPVREQGRRATAEVTLVNRRGQAIPCIYSLIREGDEWRIDGAEVLPPTEPETAARHLQS